MTAFGQKEITISLFRFAHRVRNCRLTALADILFIFVETGQYSAFTHLNIAAESFDLGFAFLGKLVECHR